MKTKILFPNSFKKVGWVLFSFGAFFGVLYLFYENELSIFNFKVFAVAEQQLFSDTGFFKVIMDNVLSELASLLLILGAILISFSREKLEDEFISKIRLDSLVWATYVNYLILAISIIFIYTLAFYWVLIFNMFTLLFFFLIRFNWVLLKSKVQLSNEE